MTRDHRTLYALALGALLAMPACTSEHGTLDGTETGNAPVALRPERITLALTPSGARVVGSPGATSPGAEVVVTSLADGTSYAGSAAADGSFAIEVASGTGGYTVKASLGGKSEDALVTLGSSAVAESALTCEQRSTQARSELNAVIATVDLACTTNADCSAVGAYSSCTSGCPTTPAGAAGAGRVDAARAALDDGACKAYLAAGCQASLALPCPAGPFLYCNAGTCAELNFGLLGACDLPFDPGSGNESTRVWWYDATSKTCLPRIYSGAGGNLNRATSQAECEAACLKDTTCGKSRGPVKDVCTETGPLGGCTVIQDVTCARVCVENTDCADEAVGTLCTSAKVCGLVGI